MNGKELIQKAIQEATQTGTAIPNVGLERVFGNVEVVTELERALGKQEKQKVMQVLLKAERDSSGWPDFPLYSSTEHNFFWAVGYYSGDSVKLREHEDPKGFFVTTNIYELPNSRKLLIPDLSRYHGAEYEFLRKTYEMFASIGNPPTARDFEKYRARRNRYMLDFAEEIKRKRMFEIFPKILKAFDVLVEDPQITVLMRRISLYDVMTLYLSVCEERKFLVGFRDGGTWKKVDFPEQADGRVPAMWDMAAMYLTPMYAIGRGQLPLVPERMFYLHKDTKVNLPEAELSMEEALQDAYFNPEYVIDPEGCEAHFNDKSDVQKIILMKTKDRLLGRVFTTHGEVLVVIDLDSAKGHIFPESIPDHEYEEYSDLIDLTAEVYHHIVTKKKIVVEVEERAGGSLKKPGKKNEYKYRPHVTYAPLVVKVGEKLTVRREYTGPRPHPKPNYVPGHKMKLPEGKKVSLEHLARVNEWYEERGLEIPDVPRGHTWVRPFSRPPDNPEAIKRYPQFVRREISEELKRKAAEYLEKLRSAKQGA